MPATLPASPPDASPFEQLMLEYINRARMDPSGEFDRLIADAATVTGVQDNVTSALRFFKTDMAVLRAQLAELSPAAPLAWNNALAGAARGHSEQMIAFDEQSHQLEGEAKLGDRVTAAGYAWNALGENVYAYAKDPLHGHAGFFIDWGSTPTGIQSPPGHRNSIMAARYTELGVAALPDTDPATDIGPFVVTQNFGNRHDYAAQLLGVAIDDADGNGFYGMGEGLAGVTVTASGAAGVFTALTGAAGGYGMELPQGSYRVTFSGGGLDGVAAYSLVMGTQNAKLDALAADAAAPAEIRGTAQGEALAGTALDDWMIGAGGADTLLGGAGDDVLIGDALTPGLLGDAAPGQIYRLYRAVLDRDPDIGGHTDWYRRMAQDDVPVAQVAAGFAGSREFQNTYGALDDAGFVQLLYQNVLDRAADAGGLADWTGRLAGGTTRAEVVLGFSESREFIRTTQAGLDDFEKAHTPAAWTGDVFRLYRAVLDRAPDAGGLADWTGRLGSGLAYEAAVQGFTDSREFRNTYGTLDDEGFVQLLYANVLDRAADAGGLADWTGRMEAGLSRAGVVAGFAQSREFIRDTAADLTAHMRALGPDDVLDGGPGLDRLAGGPGSDVFVFRAGETGGTITDFEPWDILRLEGFGYGGPAEALAQFGIAGGMMSFDDQGTSVFLPGFDLAQLEAAQIELI